MSSSTEYSTSSCYDSDDNLDNNESGKKMNKIEIVSDNCAGSLWRTATDPKSGQIYYYHLKTRETQWRKPLELASQEELQKMADKEKRQKDFFAAMEANILKSITQGSKMPQKRSNWDEDGNKNMTTASAMRRDISELPLNDVDSDEDSPESERRRNLVRTISTMDTSILRELIARAPSTRSLSRGSAHSRATTAASYRSAGDASYSNRTSGDASITSHGEGSCSSLLSPVRESRRKFKDVGDGKDDNDNAPINDATSLHLQDLQASFHSYQDSFKFQDSFKLQDSFKISDSQHSCSRHSLLHGSNGSMDFGMLSESPTRASARSSVGMGYGNSGIDFNASFLDESQLNFVSAEESRALQKLATISDEMTRVGNHFDDVSESSDISSRRSKSRGSTLRIDDELPALEDNDIYSDDDVSYHHDDETSCRDPSESLMDSHPIRKMDSHPIRKMDSHPISKMEASFKLDFECEDYDEKQFDHSHEDDEYEESMQEGSFSLDDDLLGDNGAKKFAAIPLQNDNAAGTSISEKRRARRTNDFQLEADLNQGISNLEYVRTNSNLSLGGFEEIDEAQRKKNVSMILGVNLNNIGAVSSTASLPESGSEDSKNLRTKLKKSKVGSKSCRDISSKMSKIEEEVKGKKKDVLGKRSQLSRRNTCSTLYVGTTMSAPDNDGTIKCVCGVYRAHILHSEILGDDCYHPDMYKYRVFNDLESNQTPVPKEEYHPSMDYDPDNRERPPTLNEISLFYRDVFLRAQMEPDCIIMSLIYVESLVKRTGGALRPRVCNWRSILFSCMVLSSKVWDDMSMWNKDFSQTCPSGVAFALKRINELEVAVLSALSYKVKVPASEYAKYYFLMRSMLIKSGLANEDLKDASTPLDVEGAKRLQQMSTQYQNRNKAAALETQSRANNSTKSQTNDSKSRQKAAANRSKGDNQKYFTEHNRRPASKSKVGLENIVSM